MTYNLIKGTLELFLESAVIISVLLSTFKYSNKEKMQATILFFLGNVLIYDFIFTDKVYQTITMCMLLISILKYKYDFEIKNTFYAFPVFALIVFSDYVGILFLNAEEFMIYATLYKILILAFLKIKQVNKTLFKKQMLTNISYSLAIILGVLLNITIGGDFYAKFFN